MVIHIYIYTQKESHICSIYIYTQHKDTSSAVFSLPTSPGKSTSRHSLLQDQLLGSGQDLLRGSVKRRMESGGNLGIPYGS